MRAFTSMLALVLCLCACGAAHAQQATTIINALRTLTDKSNELRGVTASITVVNVLFQGPRVGQGLASISNDVFSASSMLQNSGTAPLGAADATAVTDVLTTFVQVHQALLNTVIGKHGLLSLFFFTEPVRVALVSLEASIDSFAFALIAKIPTQAPAATAQFDTLGRTLDNAIQTYESGPAGAPPLPGGRKMLK